MKNSKIPYSMQVGIAVALGCAVGPFLSPGVSESLGSLSGLPIQFLKTLATPLVFFAITDAFCKTEFHLTSFRRLLVISSLNAVVAGAIAFVLSKAFVFSRGFLNFEALSDLGGEQSELMHKAASVEPDLIKTISEWVPRHIFEPFINNHVISVVLFAVLVGVTLRKIKQSKHTVGEFRVLAKLFSGGLQLILGILQYVLKAIPLAVFGVVARTVSVHGFQLLSLLGFFVMIVVVGLFLHTVVYYSIVLALAGVSPKTFFKQASDALITAFGTGSSLATLPVTLKVLQEKMKISTESSRLAACVGTNLNHNGILLYEVVAAFFIAEIHHIPLSTSQKVVLMGSSLLSSVGIAGIPDAGLITLSIVLNSVGLPLTFVPLLMTVDWLVGRLRAMSNVTSDMMVATLLDHPRIQIGPNSGDFVTTSDEITAHSSKKQSSQNTLLTLGNPL